jgi:hypothetical protein
VGWNDIKEAAIFSHNKPQTVRSSFSIGCDFTILFCLVTQFGDALKIPIMERTAPWQEGLALGQICFVKNLE